MSVRFQIAGPPEELKEIRDRIEWVFGPRLSTDTDLLNTPETVARWHGEIESEGR